MLALGNYFLALSYYLPMSDYLCHAEPNLLKFQADVVSSRPGAVLLSKSALHPGGGGQVSDRGFLEHAHGRAAIKGIIREDDGWWHDLDQGIEVDGEVHVEVDADHRARVGKLHTVTHILNALVFERFDGALVTGAQIYGDGTARMDFDLPGVSSEKLRHLEADINQVIRNAIDVRSRYVDADLAASTPGMIRSQSVAPPPTLDGRLRTIEIVALDEQACGGTHIANTAMSQPILITKVDNKGRHNRRVRIALDDSRLATPTDVRFV
jgi:misacylated tRNA(Ala) deacylase